MTAVQFQCPICYDDFSLKDMTIICWNEHKLCDTCYKGCCDSQRSLKCPMDRMPMFDFRITEPPQRHLAIDVALPRWKIYKPPREYIVELLYHTQRVNIDFYNGRQNAISHRDLFTTRIVNSGLLSSVPEADRQWRCDNLQDYLFLNHKRSPYNDRSRNCATCGCMGHTGGSCEILWKGFFTDDGAQIRRFGACWEEYRFLWSRNVYGGNASQRRVETLLTCLTRAERVRADDINSV